MFETAVITLREGIEAFLIVPAHRQRFLAHGLGALSRGPLWPMADLSDGADPCRTSRGRAGQAQRMVKPQQQRKQNHRAGLMHRRQGKRHTE